MKKKTRLLAPAGSMEALKAGIYSGADAIYAGGQGFNARNFAANFDEQGLREAVEFCHRYGVQFLQTLNILVSDREKEDFLHQAEYACNIGVDGVIVQDIGMLKSLRERFPELPVSGSTQMSVCNMEGVLQAAELGCRRVVLARELPLTEIADICARSPIEIETFIHGALCMCYSGQCYLSGMIGQRSGNRGQCAQPCRLPYTGTDGAEGYPLSLKDLCGAEQVQRLCEAGVDVLKIEGRMKRSEYVAVVAGVYHSILQSGAGPTQEDMDRLTTIFSRGGFTADYLLDRTGKQMFGTRTENEDTAAYRELIRETAAHCNEKDAVKRFRVDFTLEAQPETELRLTAHDSAGDAAEVTGAPPQPAKTAGTAPERVRESMEKLGGTPYQAGKVEVRLAERLFLPASELNDLRRRAIATLEQAKLARPMRRTERETALPEPNRPSSGRRFSIELQRTEQLQEEMRSAERIYLSLEEIERREAELNAAFKQGFPLVPKLPRVYFPRERAQVTMLLEKWKQAGADAALCGNIGGISLLKELDMRIWGDFSLNVYNSTAEYELLRLGLSGVTPSFELRHEALRDLKAYLPQEVIIYGRVPVMLMENCVVAGSSKNCGKCEIPRYLTDRTGERFLVRRAFGCRNELCNAHPIWLADRLEDFSWADTLRLIFITEEQQEIGRVLRAYQSGAGEPPHKFTRGLYYKGVK